MGKEKKHKKHKSDRREKYEELPVSRPPAGPGSGPGCGSSSGSGAGSGLRLVLKVALTPEHEPSTPPPAVAPLRLSMAAITEAESQRKEKKHKKKKKKDKERDREHKERHRLKKERRHLESVWSAGLEESSRLSSGTEPPLSQGTASSPEPPSVPPPPPPPEQLDSWQPSERPPSPAPAPAPAAPTAPDPSPPAAAGPCPPAAGPCPPAAGPCPPATGPCPPAAGPCPPATGPCPPAAGPCPPAAGPCPPAAGPCPPAAASEPHRPTKSALQRFLEYLLKGLEKKDTQRFFTAPVTDLLAPGYSNVIRHPMDFSTMMAKIEADRYLSLAAFQDDFRLMCSNAMAYNRPDTIYYKAAKRLLHIGSKMMSPDKLVSLRSVVPAMAELGPDVLGFQLAPQQPSAAALLAAEQAASDRLSQPEPVDEEAEAEEILRQAQAAARRAADRVAASKTAPKLGFLRQRPDGSTSLAILTPAAADGGDQEEKPVSLGVLTGRLSQGSAHPAGFREDRRNIARPVKPVHYGPYGSFGPCYDSAFANISLEESELLAQTYGDETSQQYAQSVRQFADGCQLATQMVDNLLDILTDGRHRRAQHLLDQHRQLAREERVVSAALAAAVPTPAAPAGHQVDLASLKSLSSLGIDVGFLDALEAEERRSQEAQSRLEHTSGLIASLSELQRRRLSQPAEAGPAAPSQQETELADAVASSLATLVRHTPPGEVAASAAVRKALGLGPAAASPDNPSSHEEVDVEAVSTAATPEVRRVETPPGQTPGLHELLADV